MEKNYSQLPELMTREEAQEVLRIGRSTMLRLIYSGQIKAVRIGNRFRIKRSDLADFIDSSDTGCPETGKHQIDNDSI